MLVLVFTLFFILLPSSTIFFFFFFNDTATTEIYTLSLHDALPISLRRGPRLAAPITVDLTPPTVEVLTNQHTVRDRKSTRLNSSHGYISYAVFCLKKKKNRKKKDSTIDRQRRNTSVTVAR